LKSYVDDASWMMGKYIWLTVIVFTTYIYYRAKIHYYKPSGGDLMLFNAEFNVFHLH